MHPLAITDWLHPRSRSILEPLSAYSHCMDERINSEVPRRRTLDFDDGRKIDYVRYLGNFPFSQAEQDTLNGGGVLRCNKQLQFELPASARKEDLIGCFVTNADTKDIYRITDVVSDLNPNDWATAIEIVKDGRQYPLVENITNTISRVSKLLGLIFQLDDLASGIKMKRITTEILSKREELLQKREISDSEIADLEYYLQKLD